MGLHLWYLLVLFVFSLLFYPLFRWLQDGRGQRVLNALGDLLALLDAVYLLALPIAWLLVSIDPRSDIGRRDFGGWPLPIYVLFLVYGFLLILHDGLQKRIPQLRWVSLALSVSGLFALLALWASQGDPTFGSARYMQVFGIFGASSWCWILAFVGFGFKHFTQSKLILACANEAVLPFCVLHQTVLLCVGYFVVEWQIPDALKWVVIAASSFALIMLMREFLVRRFNVMRFLFGIRALPELTRAASLAVGML